MAISSGPISSGPISANTLEDLGIRLDLQSTMELAASYDMKPDWLDSSSTMGLGATMPDPVLSGFALRSTLAMSDAIAIDLISNFVSRMRFTDSVVTSIVGQMDFRDVMELSDEVRIVHIMQLMSTLGMAGSMEINHSKNMAFLSTLAMLGSYTDSVAFAVDLASAMTLTSLTAYGRNLDSVSTMELSAAFERRYTAVVDAVSTMGMAAEFTSSQSISMALFSSASMEDSLDSLATLRMDLFDAMECQAIFKLGDDVYQGWVFATDSAAFTEYSNYPFNSLVMHNGKPYATAADGIYLLEGDDDAGDPIQASIKTKLTSFRRRAIKDCKAVYVGKNSDGVLVLKVTVEKAGELHEYWYKEKMGAHAGMHTGRFTPQRGLRSTYWQFELANQDGEDFDIEDVTILYEVLSRRIRQ